MFDIGWSELLVVAIVLIVVVGPKDLPPMIRAFGKMTANLRKMAGEFRTQFDQALKEADMDDVRRTIGDVQNLNPGNALRDAINPLRQMGQEIKSDLQKASVASSTPVPSSAPVAPLADIKAPEPEMKLPDTPPVVEAPVVAAAPVSAPVVAAVAAPSPAPVKKPRKKAAEKVKAEKVTADAAVTPARKRAPARPKAETAAVTGEQQDGGKTVARKKARKADAAEKDA